MKALRVFSLIQVVILSGGFIAFQAGRPARMRRRIASRRDGARQFQSHHRSELEAVARAGRHQPALGALLLDDETLVLGHRIEADLQPVDAPTIEVLDQVATASHQGAHLFFMRLPLTRWVAGPAEDVVADLEAAAL